MALKANLGYKVLKIGSYIDEFHTYVQDWTQLQMLQILWFFVWVSNLTKFAFFVELYKIYKNSLPQQFFRTLLRILQLYANPSAITGLRILQNVQNLWFLANFTIFRQLIAKFAIFYTSL